MDYVEYLKKYQEIPYKIFLNNFKNNSFSHAYLLSGPTGTPLLEVAKLIAKSIISKENNFLTQENIISKRIDDNTYADFILIDGKTSPIKIDQIRSLEEQFSKTGIEENQIKVYIINCIENLELDATNALLKFLEEPVENTYAFLTTENEFAVLPTILSRTQIIHFSSINQNSLIEEAKKFQILQNDAEILSFFYNDPAIMEKISQDDDYVNAKNLIFKLIKNLNNKTQFRLTIESECITSLKNKITTRFFFDLFIIFLKESLRMSYNQEIILKDSKNYLILINENVKYIDDAIIKMMSYRYELNYNLNISLLLINMSKEIFGA